MAANPASRIKNLLENYVEARKAGHMSGYDIRQVDPDNYEHYYLLIQPKNGVYKGHSYVLELKTTYGTDGSQYPMNPPYAHFTTNVFHTNISSNGGSICVDILKDKTKWMPSYSFDLIVQNILILFDEPNNASPYNSEASRLWMDCEREFKQRKAELGRNPSLKDVDRIREECFMPFSNKAMQTMQTNNLSQYYKYFPQLNNNKALMEEQKAEFDAMVAKIEEMKQRRKKDKAAEKQEEKTVDKSSRWKKYQKNTTDKPTEKPADKSTEKLTKSANKSAEKPADKPVESNDTEAKEAPLDQNVKESK